MNTILIITIFATYLLHYIKFLVNILKEQIYQLHYYINTHVYNIYYFVNLIRISRNIKQKLTQKLIQTN